jgi:hypothetical protein
VREEQIETAVRAEHDEAAQDEVIEREHQPQRTRGGGRGDGDDPRAREERERRRQFADPLLDGPPQQRELDPSRQSC